MCFSELLSALAVRYLPSFGCYLKLQTGGGSNNAVFAQFFKLVKIKFLFQCRYTLWNPDSTYSWTLYEKHLVVDSDGTVSPDLFQTFSHLEKLFLSVDLVCSDVGRSIK